MHGRVVSVAAGLSGAPVQEQVAHALELAVELNKLVATLTASDGSNARLLLSSGIHCCTAMVRQLVLCLRQACRMLWMPSKDAAGQGS